MIPGREKEPKIEFAFQGFEQGMPRNHRRYPCYLYREDTAPLRVEDTAAEQAAREQGYDSITAGALANHHLINWFWDLEDFSPKQLVVFAQDEFGVDLPIEAGQDRLFAAVVELTRHAPQNRNRLVLMAHEMTMEYDATLEEIRRMVAGEGRGLVMETTTVEVML